MNIIDRKINRWREAYEIKPGERKFLLIAEFPDKGISTPPPMRPDMMAERLEWNKSHYDYMLGRCEALDDDLLPHLQLRTGTEIHAACFGSEVYYPVNSNPCAIPFVKTESEADKVKKPNLYDTPLAALLDMAEKMREYGGKDALMGLPDMQSPMDIVALIWDKSYLFSAMYDCPEAVKTLAGKVSEFMFDFLDALFEIYGERYIAHYPSYYMEKGVTMSVDEVGAVSAPMFNEFFRDELDALSERYGGIGIHCCANARHQWENFREVKGLRLMNLTNVQTYLDDSHKVFAKTCMQYPILSDYANPAPLKIAPPEQYPAGSYVLTVRCESIEHAKKEIDRLKEIY